MNRKNNAEIPDRPSDPETLLSEIIPVWEKGSGTEFKGTFQPIPELRNTDHASTVYLTLPKIIYAMTGNETRIYFNNLVYCRKKSDLKFSAECEIGTANDSYWSVRPESPGEYPLKISVEDSAGRVVGTAETVVRIAAAGNGNEQNIVVMIVGDSIMGNGKIADFLQENIKKNGNTNIRFMGSHSGNGAPLSIGKAAVEAYGGGCWGSFMTLWNPGNEYNKRTKFMKMENGQLVEAVQEYLDKYNQGKAPDIVIFSLGCNDIACADMGTIDNAIEQSVINRDKLLAMFRKVMPETLFGLVLLAPPNGRSQAFEINYKGAISRNQYLFNQFFYIKRTLEDLENSGECSLIPVYAGVDEFADYPEDNAVHPNETGQKRFAEMLESWLKNLKYSS